MHEAATAWVIDDDVSIHRLIERSLIEANIASRSFFDGSSVLTFLTTSIERPDVLIVDLMMPGVVGFDLVDELRSREELASVPIVVVTAHAEVCDASRAADHGAAFLTKPFRIHAFLATVTRVLQWSQPFELPPQRSRGVSAADPSSGGSK